MTLNRVAISAIPTTDASWPELESPLTSLLQQGCDDLELVVDPARLQQLLDYLALLAKWNKAYNLTAVRDESLMVTRHLLDSLAIAPFISAQRLIDVGSGDPVSAA